MVVTEDRVMCCTIPIVIISRDKTDLAGRIINQELENPIFES